MSQPLQERRSERNREPRRSYADEQAYGRLQEERKAEVARVVREAQATVEPSDSDDCELSAQEASSSEDDAKAAPNDENVGPWSQELQDVNPPVCAAVATVLLPRNVARTELGYLQAFIDDALIDLFVTNTNLYATARPDDCLGPCDCGGAVALPRCAHSAGYRRPAAAAHVLGRRFYRDRYISQLMSRDRFMDLHRYFHIVRAGASWSTADCWGEDCALLPSVSAAVRLLLPAWPRPGRGRDHGALPRAAPTGSPSSKAKPVHLWATSCTPLASDGYLLAFRIYRGKGGYDIAQNPLQHTVADLVRPWSGAHHCLYFDNLYTSPDLCDQLLQMEVRSCGTCRPNRRGLPASLRTARSELAKGEMRSWQRGQLGCLLWSDARPVIFLSTIRRVDQLTPIPAHGGCPATIRPTVAVDYNYNKGHVDQIDQLRAYYVVERRGRRTWLPLAWWLFDVCIINAYKLWCLHRSVKPGVLHFRDQLQMQIAAAYPSPHTPVQPAAPAVVQRGYVGHWPKKVELWRNCVHCSTGRRRRHKTDFQCAVCGVHLHPDACFGAYHDRLDIDNGQL